MIKPCRVITSELQATPWIHRLFETTISLAMLSAGIRTLLALHVLWG